MVGILGFDKMVDNPHYSEFLLHVPFGDKLAVGDRVIVGVRISI